MRLIRPKEAAALVGYHRVHLCRLARTGQFPKPVQLGDHGIAFVEAEVLAWIKRKIDERDAETPNSGSAEAA